MFAVLKQETEEMNKYRHQNLYAFLLKVFVEHFVRKYCSNNSSWFLNQYFCTKWCRRNYVKMLLRGESIIDFRAQCVIMAQITWPPIPYASFPDFRQNWEFSKKYIKCSWQQKTVDYTFEEPLSLHIIVG